MKFLRPIQIQTAANEAPLSVNSQTAVANLNADLLDGLHASNFLNVNGNISNLAVNIGYYRLFRTTYGVWNVKYLEMLLTTRYDGLLCLTVHIQTDGSSNIIHPSQTVRLINLRPTAYPGFSSNFYIANDETNKVYEFYVKTNGTYGAINAITFNVRDSWDIGITYFSNLDPQDLTEITVEPAALSSSRTSIGFVARVDNNNSYQNRSITAGSSKISIVNGNGANGNPTIDVVESQLNLNNIGGVLPVNKGGTGLSSIGSSNRVLGVNNAATALEYKSIVGTANRINVTHGANTITISTPQDINTTSEPTFKSVTIETSGNKIYRDSASNRIRIDTNGNQRVAEFASYGLYLPVANQVYNLYVAGSIQIGYTNSDPAISFRNGNLELKADSTLRARLTDQGQLQIFNASGVMPIVVNSTVMCQGLNADLVDGKHGPSGIRITESYSLPSSWTGVTVITFVGSSSSTISFTDAKGATYEGAIIKVINRSSVSITLTDSSGFRPSNSTSFVLSANGIITLTYDGAAGVNGQWWIE